MSKNKITVDDKAPILRDALGPLKALNNKLRQVVLLETCPDLTKKLEAVSDQSSGEGAHVQLGNRCLNQNVIDESIAGFPADRDSYGDRDSGPLSGRVHTRVSHRVIRGAVQNAGQCTRSKAS